MAAGLEAVLRSEGAFTLFAPTDRAFRECLGNYHVEELLEEENAEELRQLLLYHVVPGVVLEYNDMEEDTLVTAQGNTIQLEYDGWDHSVYLNDHTEITRADIEATNGIIHAIDCVLEPPQPLPTIFGYLQSMHKFDTLVELIELGGLVDTLNSGEYTLFAPTDWAFLDTYGHDGVEELLQLDANTIREFLLYHVLSGKKELVDFEDNQDYVTLTQATDMVEVTFSHSWDCMVLNDFAYVDDHNIHVTNGVIHEIDRSLSPPSLDLQIGTGDGDDDNDDGDDYWW